MNFLNFGKLPSHDVALNKRNNEIAEYVSTPIAVTIALCFAGGFFLLILFMGWGIVRIPIDTWIESNLNAKLNRILFKVASYEEKIIRQQNKVQVLFNIAKEIKVEEEI